jgi:hypothetical protein
VTATSVTSINHDRSVNVNGQSTTVTTPSETTVTVTTSVTDQSSPSVAVAEAEAVEDGESSISVPSASTSTSSSSASASASGMDAKTSLRLQVLRGLWPAGVTPRDIRPPTRKLSVFISSTFTDTHRERDYIMKELLPPLRREAATMGVQIVFVDMR